MAGIGFELKKLFDGKSFPDYIKAYFVSAIVVAGPMILCIGMLTIMQLLLQRAEVNQAQNALFFSGMVYAFIFSLIVTGVFSTVVSRYIADMLYLKKYDLISASFYGVITVCLPIGGILGAVLFQSAPVDLLIKLAVYVLYMQLIVIWVQAIYVALFRDYASIFAGFLAGVAIAIIGSYVILKVTDVKPVLGLFLAINLGFFTIMFSYMHRLSRYIGGTKESIFGVLSYFAKYPSLVAIGTFYYLGIYAHNFVFWFSDYGVREAGALRSAPFYDVPMFYAYLTIIPTLILFVVAAETSFFEKYRKYFGLINSGGTRSDIEAAKKEMLTVVDREFSYIMEVQLFFTIMSLLIGRKVLSSLGLSPQSIDIFGTLVLSCYLFAMMFVIIQVLLYFDDRKGALVIVSFFLLSNTVASMLTLNLGEAYFGLGFFVASLSSFIIGISRISYFTKNIDYYVFCAQPMTQQDNSGLLARILDSFVETKGSINR